MSKCGKTAPFIGKGSDGAARIDNNWKRVIFPAETSRHLLLS